MDANTIQDFLLWSLAVNYTFLLIWFGAFSLAHEWLYTFHSRWFRLSLETFDTIHYAGMALYKIAILVLNLVPLTALLMI